MRKNNFLNKVIVTSLTVILLALPTLSFADVATVKPLTDKVTALDKLDMRVEAASARLEEKAADALAKRDA